MNHFKPKIYNYISHKKEFDFVLDENRICNEETDPVLVLYDEDLGWIIEFVDEYYYMYIHRFYNLEEAINKAILIAKQREVNIVYFKEHNKPYFDFN